MSRSLALFAVAALAFCVAPRPVEFDPPPREVDWELIVPTPEGIVGHVLSDEDPGLDSKIEGFEIERLAKAPVDFVTQDNIGPPSPEPVLAVALTDDGEFVLVLANDLPDNTPPVLDLPRAFWSRGGATKSRWLREGGGSWESERAVALGLAWLAGQQKQDGSWEFDAGEWQDNRIASTGLALLPYLGAGCTHKGKSAEYGARYIPTVRRGLEFLMKYCPPSGGRDAGKMSHNMRAQAIGTLALYEAYGLTYDLQLRPHAQAAINFLQRSQGTNGGWAEVPGEACDIHTTGWVLQALRCVRYPSALEVDWRVTDKAVAFLRAVAGGSRKAAYGTTDNSDAQHGTRATATGLWCRYYIDGWGPSHPGMIDGVAGLAKNPPSAANRDPLYLYYATWALWGYYESTEWRDWNEGPKDADGIRKGGVRDLLVNSQFRKDGPLLGSWEPAGGYGRLGTTALSVLTLEVYYRYLPLYKRGP